MRHINACDSFIKQLVKRKLVQLEKIGTKENNGDLLTKYVNAETFDRLVPKTGYRPSQYSDAAVQVKLVKLNSAKDLECADHLVDEHERKVKEQLKLKSK